MIQARVVDIDETQEQRGMQAGHLPITYAVRAAFALVARGTPIPPAERKLGFDISKWQGVENHETAKNAGIQFAYFKATQHTTILDGQFINNYTNVGDRYPWGAYHFLTTASGSQQANWFCDAVNDHTGQLPPVVDVELQVLDSAVIQAFVAQVFSRLNKWPMIYTSAYFWGKISGNYKTWLGQHCQLWVAHYGTLSPILPTDWSTYVVHQFSADGNNRGHEFGGQCDDMDLDYCRQSWLDLFSPSPATSCLSSLVAWAREDPIRPYTGPGPED